MFSGVFRRMADAIRETNKPTTVLGVLRPIDTDRIARELQLDRIAAERGGENLPSSTSISLDAVEQQIVPLMESEWSWQGGEFINNLRSYPCTLRWTSSLGLNRPRCAPCSRRARC